MGATALLMAFVGATFTQVMGFDFDPTEHPAEYWPKAVTYYTAVLSVVLGLASLGAVCFIGRAVVAGGGIAPIVTASFAVVLGLCFGLLALHGALPNIEHAQVRSTRPPI